MADATFAAHVLGLVVGISTVHAEPDDEASSQVAAAQTQFERGVARFEDGDLAGALAAFQRAYELEPHPQLFYNIGVVQLEMGDYAAATRSLERYLGEGGESVSAQRRTEVEGRLDALAARIGRLTVRSDVEGAEVRVDGELVGTIPLDDAIVLNPGTRRVEVSAPGHVASVESIIIAPGRELVLEANLTERPVPKQPIRDTHADPPVVRRLKISTFVTLGVTVACGAAAIATGVSALQADDELLRQLDTFPADLQAVSAAQDRRDTFASATNGLIAATAIVAAATLATGVAAIVLERKHGGERRHRRGRAAGLTIRF